MSFGDVLAEIDAVNRAIVLANTWGHLAPKPQNRYLGYILFTVGEYGDVVPIKAEFEGMNDNPWFYEDMTEFISDWACKRGNDAICEQREDSTPGKVYRWSGTYRKCNTGTYYFTGKIVPVELSWKGK